MADRLTVKIPPKCPACRQEGTIQLEQVLKDETFSLQWCCRACKHVWPVYKTD